MTKKDDFIDDKYVSGSSTIKKEGFEDASTKQYLTGSFTQLQEEAPYTSDPSTPLQEHFVIGNSSSSTPIQGDFMDDITQQKSESLEEPEETIYDNGKAQRIKIRAKITHD